MHPWLPRLVAVLAVAGGASCSLIVDVGELARDDAGRAETDGVVEADGEGDGGGDEDLGVDVELDTDTDTEPDSDGDLEAAAEADADTSEDTDAESDADADVGADSDADAADAPDGDGGTVGPPARIWGELTGSGAPVDAAGCAARGVGICLRSDTTDSTGQMLAAGAFRLRGIVVQGGAR